MQKKPSDPTVELTAAVLTLSQGLDAVHEMLRKLLRYSVDQYGGKIPETFIPGSLVPTARRYETWQEELSGATKSPQGNTETNP